MLTSALVAFALKEEFAPWRRRHRFRPVANSPHSVFATTIGSMQVYVTLAGVGAPNAQSVVTLAGNFRPSLAIVAGVAAGLKPQWRPRDILVAESVTGPGGTSGVCSSPDLVEIAKECGAKPARTLVTLPRIVRTVADKTRLGHSADAADMESAILMNYWSARHIPSVALRVVLDPVEMPMTCDFERAMDAHGQVQIRKIIVQLGGRPQLLPGFLRLARQSRQAMLGLAQFLDRYFDHLNDRCSPGRP